MPDLDRWRRAWEALGLEPSDHVFDSVLARYGEPHRAYHTLVHLDECFAALDPARALAERLPEIEIAIWFHDALYDPHAEDNEERSAEWAYAALVDAGAAPKMANRIRVMILATKHGAPPLGNDAMMLVDVDLSILGTDSRRFAEYEDQIRTEYEWVPVQDYRRARIRVLRGFLERDEIYFTGWFRRRLEQQARENLLAAVRRLSV